MGRRRTRRNGLGSADLGKRIQAPSSTLGPPSTSGRHTRHRNASVLSPSRTGAFSRFPWWDFVVCLGGVLGLVAQVLLLYLGWELWDVSVSVMELWGRLAELHLELTTP